MLCRSGFELNSRWVPLTDVLNEAFLRSTFAVKCRLSWKSLAQPSPLGTIYFKYI